MTTRHAADPIAFRHAVFEIVKRTVRFYYEASEGVDGFVRIFLEKSAWLSCALPVRGRAAFKLLQYKDITLPKGG